MLCVVRGSIGCGDQYGRISLSAFRLDNPEVFSCHTSRGIDDFANRIAVPRSQIDWLGGNSAFHQCFQSGDMRTGEISDVNIVSQAGTVGCGVIRSEDLYFVTPARSRIKDQRNEVGFGIMIFPEFAIAVGARRVEVSQ